MTKYFAQLIVAFSIATAHSNALNIDDYSKYNSYQVCTCDNCTLQKVCHSPAFWCKNPKICDPTPNNDTRLKTDPFIGTNFISAAYGIVKLLSNENSVDHQLITKDDLLPWWMFALSKNGCVFDQHVYDAEVDEIDTAYLCDSNG